MKKREETEKKEETEEKGEKEKGKGNEETETVPIFSTKPWRDTRIDILSKRVRNNLFFALLYNTISQDTEELKQMITTYNIPEKSEIDYINVLFAGEIGDGWKVSLTD